MGPRHERGKCSSRAGYWHWFPAETSAIPLGGEREEADAAEEVTQEQVLLHAHKTGRWRGTESEPVHEASMHRATPRIKKSFCYYETVGRVQPEHPRGDLLLLDLESNARVNPLQPERRTPRCSPYFVPPSLIRSLPRRRKRTEPAPIHEVFNAQNVYPFREKGPVLSTELCALPLNVSSLEFSWSCFLPC